MQNTVRKPQVSDKILWDTWLSMYSYPTLVFADEKGIFSLLNKKSTDAATVAVELGIGIRSTEIILGLLSSIVFLSCTKGVFSLNEISQDYLLPQSPYYWGGIFRMRNNSPMLKSLREAVLNDTLYGRNMKNKLSVTEQWQGQNMDLDIIKSFTAAMHSHSFSSAVSMADKGDFKDTRVLLDVGGGSGCYSIALANKYPTMQFKILEMQQVCGVTQSYIEKEGLCSQISICSGDMFGGSWPLGADGVFFSNILHDWSLEQCLQLARKTFDYLPIGGHIFIHEILFNDDKSGPYVAAGLSMAMLMTTEGRQYSFKELENILIQSGFTDAQSQSMNGYFSLISARKK